MEFKKDLEKLNITLSEKQLKQFEDYYAYLIEMNQVMNLTAITDKEEVYKKHFIDSLTISKDYTFTNQSLLDVGAGAGFPSIPLKIVYPNLKITIVDSLGKRIKFLNELVKKLDLENVEAIHARAEEFVKDRRESYDIVTARAVAKLNILSELCLPFVKVGGDFLVLKGSNGIAEIYEAKNGIKQLGGSIEYIREFNLTSDHVDRVNCIIHKNTNTNMKYPRDYARIKKKPL